MSVYGHCAYCGREMAGPGGFDAPGYCDYVCQRLHLLYRRLNDLITELKQTLRQEINK
jgi:hypothetical protein